MHIYDVPILNIRMFLYKKYQYRLFTEQISFPIKNNLLLRCGSEITFNSLISYTDLVPLNPLPVVKASLCLNRIALYLSYTFPQKDREARVNGERLVTEGILRGQTPEVDGEATDFWNGTERLRSSGHCENKEEVLKKWTKMSRDKLQRLLDSIVITSN